MLKASVVSMNIGVGLSIGIFLFRLTLGSAIACSDYGCRYRGRSSKPMVVLSVTSVY